MTTVNGKTTEIWNYTHATTTTNPLLYVPIVGLFTLAFDDEAITSDSEGLTLIFSEKGIVQSITRGTTHSQIGGSPQIHTHTDTEIQLEPTEYTIPSQPKEK